MASVAAAQYLRMSTDTSNIRSSTKQPLFSGMPKRTDSQSFKRTGSSGSNHQGLRNRASAVCSRAARQLVRATNRSHVLWKSHGYYIPTACFGLIEALVRNIEQIKRC